MSNFDLQTQKSMKRRWQEQMMIDHTTSSNSYNTTTFPSPSSIPFLGNPKSHRNFPGFLDDDLVSSVVPAVTVVLEGRSICQRISLENHGSYKSLAKALRHMFVHGDASPPSSPSSSDNGRDGGDVDLSNAVPGHLIAYEDMENDLLLVGDLNWEDFVRVAKRIRILPAKGRSITQKKEMN